MKDILSKGGDTDTNACIVGGLLGASQSVTLIDKNMIDKMITCRFDQENYQSYGSTKPRDQFLIPAYYLVPLILKLFVNAPKRLEVVCKRERMTDLDHIKTIFEEVK